MRLLIFPGAGSPNHAHHRDVYLDLCHVATRWFPESRVELLTYPGQSAADGAIEGELTVAGAVDLAADHLRAVANDEVIVFARSLGCTIAASIVAAGKAPNVRRIVYWAPPPFWLWYDWFVRRFEVHGPRMLEQGTRITHRFAEGAVAFESVVSSSIIDSLICTGTEDTICYPTYLEYLRVAIPEKQNIRYEVIGGCGHSPTKRSSGWSNFENAIFSFLKQ